MRINFRQFEYLIAKLASDPKAQNDFFDYATGAPNPNVLVAAWTVFVKLQPVFNTPLAKELVTIITLFSIPRDFEADLTENEPCKLFANFESTN